MRKDNSERDQLILMAQRRFAFFGQMSDTEKI